MTGVKRKQIRKRVRDRIKLGQSCIDCGSLKRLEIDHIWPVSKGGTNDPLNLAVRCRKCNQKKGASTGAQWRERKAFLHGR